MKKEKKKKKEVPNFLLPIGISKGLSVVKEWPQFDM